MVSYRNICVLLLITKLISSRWTKVSIQKLFLHDEFGMSAIYLPYLIEISDEKTKVSCKLWGPIWCPFSKTLIDIFSYWTNKRESLIEKKFLTINSGDLWRNSEISNRLIENKNFTQFVQGRTMSLVSIIIISDLLTSKSRKIKRKTKLSSITKNRTSFLSSNRRKWW